MPRGVTEDDVRHRPASHRLNVHARVAEWSSGMVYSAFRIRQSGCCQVARSVGLQSALVCFFFIIFYLFLPRMSFRLLSRFRRFGACFALLSVIVQVGVLRGALQHVCTYIMCCEFE